MFHENNFIINRVSQDRNELPTGSSSSMWTNFNIKIYENGNIDIKNSFTNSCSGQPDQNSPEQYLLIISDNKIIPEYNTKFNQQIKLNL